MGRSGSPNRSAGLAFAAVKLQSPLLGAKIDTKRSYAGCHCRPKIQATLPLRRQAPVTNRHTICSRVRRRDSRGPRLFFTPAKDQSAPVRQRALRIVGEDSGKTEKYESPIGKAGCSAIDMLASGVAAAAARRPRASRGGELLATVFTFPIVTICISMKCGCDFSHTRACDLVSK